MPDPLRDRVATVLADAYELEAEIGRGGMGVVYRCVDRKLRRRVAVKVLPPDLAFRDEVRRRFLREAETAAQLNHPHIVPIYSVDDRDGLVWFVMGLVDGESLAARLAREPRPPVEMVRRILHDVADALAYAHARGIIHRDIKPDNILLERGSNRPMVSDFGIARAAEGDWRITATGVAVGTPAYMSPEQATGEREVDGRSDMYSLAVVGYQMLAGELPFQATNTPAMLMKHISDPLRPLLEVRPDAPPALAAVIERALAKKPDHRYPDAATFARAVEQSAFEPGQSAPADRPSPSAAWKRPAVPRSAVPLPPPPSSNGGAPKLPRLRQPTPAPASDRGSHGAGDRARHNQGRPLSRRSWATPVDELPPLPAWMPASWHAARREWRERDGARRSQLERARDDRIRRFRRQTANAAITVGMLGTINVMFAPGFLWFLFPAAFMGLGLLRQGASLWADGVRLRDVFGPEAADRLARRDAPPSRQGRGPTGEPAAQLAPPEVLAGPYGSFVRRAAADRAAAHEAVSKLSPADRALIPDVAPTVDALAERVGSIASALHQLDEDATPEALAAVERQIRETEALPASPARDRKLELLERRRTTLGELVSRRDTLRTQLESAALMLQNMRLDLLALGSVGVQSALNDVTSATQEARALSREIQHVIDAAREVR